MLMSDGNVVPKQRYTSRVFADAEMDGLWPRVWQIACREEELPRSGDFVEYLIGDQSILVVREPSGEIAAFFNTCLHRGTRLAAGHGCFDEVTGIRCRYHGWTYDLTGRVIDIPDAEEFPNVGPDRARGGVRAAAWGGVVLVNHDAHAEPLLDFLAPLPKLLDAYHLDQLRFRSYRTTILPANWKVVVDAFNESYHVQGTHPQILPWTDDTSIEYEQFETHAHYGRLPNARRELRPSPRLGLADDAYDEFEILMGLVAGLGGAFLHEERALVEELRGGTNLLAQYQEKRRALLEARGFDTAGLELAQMTSADDVYCFPNVVGPIYPGSAILFRVRPNGLDPDSCIKDTWVLEWPRSDQAWSMPERKFYADWTEKDWGPITNQDYANMSEVQIGMKSLGCDDLQLNPRQEGNILHMHRVIDRYLA
jgi:nitrite reductase/ring-hydroxylating ferredoxin subunit